MLQKVAARPAESGLSLSCFRSFDEAIPWREALDAINLAAPRPDPFSTFGFLEHYFEYDEYFSGGQGFTLWLLVVFRGQEPIGYLPLKHTEERILGLQASPATVVRFVNNPEMEDTARRLVRQLGVSGLVGFDFMVEAATGAAHLIEMNVRATPACHLPNSHGTALTASLLARLRGEGPPRLRPRFASGMVVMFPGEFRANPCSPYLQTAGHDVPWEHPALVRDGLEPPWAERGWLAQVRRRWRTSRVSGLQRRGSVLAGSN